MMLVVSKLYDVNDGLINKFGAVLGMRIGEGNRSARRKSILSTINKTQLRRLFV
jgi:hypothetical protein